MKLSLVFGAKSYFGVKERRRKPQTGLTVTLSRRQMSELQQVAAATPRFGKKGFQANAADVISRFGGVSALQRAFKAAGMPHDRVSIYKWTYPYPKGTGNRVPHGTWPKVCVAAKTAKVSLYQIGLVRSRKAKPEVIDGFWQRDKYQTGLIKIGNRGKTLTPKDKGRGSGEWSGRKTLEYITPPPQKPENNK